MTASATRMAEGVLRLFVCPYVYVYACIYVCVYECLHNYGLFKVNGFF